MDISAIIAGLAPLSRDVIVNEDETVQITITSSEYDDLFRVIGMLGMAEMMNSKQAQASYPRLFAAVSLVLAIADNPGENLGEQISLSPRTRAQLEAALQPDRK